MSDRMPEDLPITKCINVMVGITRSKVIYWNKFLVQILGKGHFKSGRPCKTSTKQEFCSSSPFVKKFFFSFQAQSCPRLFRALPLTLLRQTAAYKCFQFFLKSCLQSLCVCNCRGLAFFNQSHCLSKACVPAKEELFFVGFLSKCFTNSPQLRATFCHLRRFSGTCCLEALLQALQPSA